MTTHIAIKGRFISQDDGVIILAIDATPDYDISQAIAEHAKNLVKLGVSKRMAFGMADDARDEIFRDAIARSITLDV